MNQNTSGFIVVLITASSEAEADKISSSLLEKRLAACVNRYPIHSMYQWEGKIQCDREWQLTIKTQQSRFEQLSSVIQSIHSYEVPEIIALPIVKGHPTYLDWIATETIDSIET